MACGRWGGEVQACSSLHRIRCGSEGSETQVAIERRGQALEAQTMDLVARHAVDCQRHDEAGRLVTEEPNFLGSLAVYRLGR